MRLSNYKHNCKEPILERAPYKFNFSKQKRVAISIAKNFLLSSMKLKPMKKKKILATKSQLKRTF